MESNQAYIGQGAHTHTHTRLSSVMSCTCSQYLDGPGVPGHQRLVGPPHTRHAEDACASG